MRTKLLSAFMLLAIAAFGQQSPIQIDANGLTQTFGAGGIVTRGQIVKINSSGQIVPMATTDTSGAVGIAATSQQNVGQVVAVSIGGSPLVQVDGSCAPGNLVGISSTAGGSGHCGTTVTGQVGIALTAANNGFAQVQWTGSGGGGGGISSVATLAATCTPGTTTPVQLTSSPFGIFYCTAVNTWTADNPSASVSPIAFGGKFDVKFIYDAAFTNTNATVTCPNNDCSFQCPGGVYPCTSATTGCATPSFSCDVGKIIFGTTDSNIASSIGSGLATAQNTITTVNSASSATMSAAATATCTVAGSVLCDLAWGSADDTTAINNAMTFAWGTAGVCRALQFPSANYFFSAPILSMTIAQLSQACGGTVGAAGSSGVDTNQVGPETFGQGPGNTVGIPLPNFSYPCTNNVCIGNTGNLEIHDMGWNGLGQILNGRNDSNMNFMQLQGSNGGGACTGSTGFNFALSGWGYSDVGTNGLNLGGNACGDPVYSNIVVERAGSTNCIFQSSLVTAYFAVACLGSPVRVLQLNCTGNGNQIINTYGSEFVDLNVAGPVITQNSCVWNDYGSWINSTVSSSTLYQNTAAVTTQANFTGTHFDGNAGPSAQIFLGQASAGTTSIHVRSVTFNLNATTKLLNINSATAYFDDGGNNYGTAGAASTIPTGALISADGHNVKGIGTGTCTASSTLGLRVSGTSLTGTGITTACTSATLDAGVAVSGSRTINGLLCTSSATTVSVTCTLMVSHNGGAFAAFSPSVTCTMTAAVTCNDTTHYPVAADGDLVTVQITTGAAETGANIKAIGWWN